MKSAAQRQPSSTLKEYLLESRLYYLEILHLLWSAVHALAVGVAATLHLVCGWSGVFPVAAFIITNPLWAHVVLWSFRRKG